MITVYIDRVARIVGIAARGAIDWLIVVSLAATPAEVGQLIRMRRPV